MKKTEVIKNTVIRVGEKNNFNHSPEEFKELEKFEAKGSIFVNSNAFNPISAKYPSIITINPYMKFVPLTGDLSNVKAVRIKMFFGTPKYRAEMKKCIEFCCENDLKILATFMRFKSMKTAKRYCGINYRTFYTWRKNYFRPIDQTRLMDFVNVTAANKACMHLVNICDAQGKGCPSCMNCSLLTFGTNTATIKALNLAVSGKKDARGKQGLCKYNCPDCFGKACCYGYSPRCGVLITNAKIDGKLDTTTKAVN